MQFTRQHAHLLERTLHDQALERANGLQNEGDLETGDHPMSNEDASIQVVFNGEIYN